jgi:hypothetical protein
MFDTLNFKNIVFCDHIMAWNYIPFVGVIAISGLKMSRCAHGDIATTAAATLKSHELKDNTYIPMIPAGYGMKFDFDLT